MRVSIRGFKQLFSLVFAVILGCLGFTCGIYIKNNRPVAPPSTAPAGNLGLLAQGFDDLTKTGFVYWLLIALAALGFLFGIIIGPKIAQKIVNAGNSIERMSTREKIAVAIGTVIGVLLTLPFFVWLLRIPLVIGLSVSVLLCVAFVYLSIRAMLSMKDEFRFVGPATAAMEADDPASAMEHCKILDTNVIIDGRIADICRTGFIEGPIYVPGFVLDELQHIADSSDSLKRARGRRGLDILNAMQKDFPLIVRTYDNVGDGSGGAVPDEVDARLVYLAKDLGGTIVTNDFNLNKVAALQGVTVLNVNELANALKPVVLPGEEMPVTIIKEGKEQNQGVAYLDDGTMVVVEDGRRHIGDHTEVVVTSVLQTVAGKMIFARMKGMNGEEEEGRDGGPRGTGGRSRYKVR